MGHAVSLGLLLFGLWVLLSGYLDNFLLVGLGLLSSGWVVWIALRMEVVDQEWHPVHLLFTRFLFRFLPWLLWEVVKANIDVTRRILDPKLPISPTITRIRPSQRTDIGQVTFANCITLTPGTVSIDLKDGEIEVHALTREAAEALHDSDMDRRVAVLEKSN